MLDFLIFLYRKEVLNFYRHKIKDDLHVGIQDQSYIMFDVYFKMFNINTYIVLHVHRRRHRRC